MSKEFIGEFCNKLRKAAEDDCTGVEWLLNDSATLIESQALEIERLKRSAQTNWNEFAEGMKAQPSGVVLPEWLESSRTFVDRLYAAGWRDHADAQHAGAAGLYDELIARLNSSTDSAGATVKQSLTAGGVDERAAFEVWAKSQQMPLKRDGVVVSYAYRATDIAWNSWQARAALSAPSHGEQVRVVPVEPTDAMLEAGDKYIGTPATYKAMLSACPSPAITKDFSQFLSAVMDAAGLIRHGRQSKELSEYLGMKCMEYRGVAPSAGSQKEQGE